MAKPPPRRRLSGGLHRRHPREDPRRAVANRPIYVALAVTTEGRREVLGLWAGDGGEGAKHWLHILTEIKNRGVSARPRSYASAASVNSCSHEGGTPVCRRSTKI